MAQHFAVVIRADGSVPFDNDVHPDHRKTILGHLVAAGHNVQVNQDTQEVTIQNYQPVAQNTAA
jgi:hypothetical protein